MNDLQKSTSFFKVFTSTFEVKTLKIEVFTSKIEVKTLNFEVKISKIEVKSSKIEVKTSFSWSLSKSSLRPFGQFFIKLLLLLKTSKLGRIFPTNNKLLECNF
jgi:hypothetical protein